ncbi:MAG: hypothetical protein KAQ94_02175 [Arcobacteraceae bacterium]|nr:hypothetical protein [Arcobacteraceae bacterium]
MIIGTATVTESAIYVKLSQKYAELYSHDKNQQQEEVLTQKQDYIDITSSKYEKNDYERVLEKFKSMDSNTRSHEQAHASLANTTTPIQYNYQMGPDGKMYATGGHVRLDTSMPDDPKAASVKLDQIKRSATANGDMSSADGSIAIGANLMKMRLQLEEDNSQQV